MNTSDKSSDYESNSDYNIDDDSIGEPCSNVKFVKPFEE